MTLLIYINLLSTFTLELRILALTDRVNSEEEKMSASYNYINTNIYLSHVFFLFCMHVYILAELRHEKAGFWPMRNRLLRS